LIGKWLNAGVLEDGNLWFPEEGSPQGGVISPLLANIYLHYVLDEWFARDVQPRMKGRSFLIRYADDFVMGFACEEDARRVMAVLGKRFEKYGLTIHPEKTRLVPFRRPQHPTRPGGPGNSGPEAFDLLGFTHHWALSRKGRWVVKQRTASSRLSRALQAIGEWCRENRHRPLILQHRTLSQKMRGHYAYYGITGNARALGGFQYVVRRLWRKWLSRRKRGSDLTWDLFARMMQRYPLPMPVVVHSVYRRGAKP
jgi:hypothetical protein